MVKLIYELDLNQIEDLTNLYQKEWWSKDRNLEDVKIMITKSDLILGLVEDNKLVGFTRVLSDYIYKAIIFDVIIVEQLRNKGLGRLLMESIIHHPELTKTSHFELYCLPEMELYYQSFNFKTLAKEKDFYFMRFTR